MCLKWSQCEINDMFRRSSSVRRRHQQRLALLVRSRCLCCLLCSPHARWTARSLSLYGCGRWCHLFPVNLCCPKAVQDKRVFNGYHICSTVCAGWRGRNDCSKFQVSSFIAFHQCLTFVERVATMPSILLAELAKAPQLCIPLLLCSSISCRTTQFLDGRKAPAIKHG